MAPPVQTLPPTSRPERIRLAIEPTERCMMISQLSLTISAPEKNRSNIECLSNFIFRVTFIDTKFRFTNSLISYDRRVK
jgi:hypothetical protein